MLLCIFTLSGLKCGRLMIAQGVGVVEEEPTKNVEKSSCCILIWSGKNYGHGQGKSGNLIRHKEWEPCFCFRCVLTNVRAGHLAVYCD